MEITDSDVYYGAPLGQLHGRGRRKQRETGSGDRMTHGILSSWVDMDRPLHLFIHQLQDVGHLGRDVTLNQRQLFAAETILEGLTAYGTS